MTRRQVLPALGAAAAALLIGCGGDDGGATSGLDAGDDYSVEAALAELPVDDTIDGLLIQTGDLVGATEVSGLERPAADTDDVDALLAWIGPLTGFPAGGADVAPVFVPVADVFNVNELLRFDEFREEVGWSILEAESFVERQTPPNRFSVVRGDFDDATFPDSLEALDEGIVSAGSGDDFATDLAERTAARPLGTPLRMATRDGLIAASPDTEAIEAWLDGPSPSLADDEALTAVAAALDDADVVSAVLTGGTPYMPMGGEAPSAEQLEQVQGSLPPMFLAVGVGWGVDDDGDSEITIAYQFPNADLAADAVTVFEGQYDEPSVASGAPLSELVTLQGVASDGSVVTVTLTPAADRSAMIAYQMLVNRDLPFVHQ